MNMRTPEFPIGLMDIRVRPQLRMGMHGLIFCSLTLPDLDVLAWCNTFTEQVRPSAECVSRVRRPLALRISRGAHWYFAFPYAAPMDLTRVSVAERSTSWRSRRASGARPPSPTSP